jgi:hypothetical protein
VCGGGLRILCGGTRSAPLLRSHSSLRMIYLEWVLPLLIDAERQAGAGTSKWRWRGAEGAMSKAVCKVHDPLIAGCIVCRHQDCY